MVARSAYENHMEWRKVALQHILELEELVGKDIWRNSTFSFPQIPMKGLYMEREIKPSKKHFLTSV